MTLNTIKVGSLFSGIGGIELGLERTGGFETAWFVEKDLYAQAVLRKHWAKAKIYDDITTINWNEVERVDVLTGGFPCQDISNAGKRVGIGGERSGLWKEFAKAISVLRPRVVFIENVAALLNRGMDVVLADLAALGYDAEWHCLPARDVGAPHRRDRVFIIASNPQRVRLERGRNERSMGKKSQEVERQGSEFANTTQKFGIMEDSECNRIIEGNREEVTCGEENRECSNKSCGTSEGEREFSYTNSERCVHGQFEKYAGENRNNAQRDITSLCSKIPNAQSSRQSSSIIRQAQKQLRKSHTRNRKIKGGQWSAEPDVGRVANGVSFRVDRIKCLGNAVVPQCAEFFAERIKEKVKEGVVE